MTTALAPELPEDTSPSGRPVWALTGEDMLSELDALHVGICRAETRRLALLAELDKIGHAKDIGARGTTDLIARRHRLDYYQVQRDLRLAKALPKYSVVQQALDNGPHTGPTHPDPDPAPDTSADADVDGPDAAMAGEPGDVGDAGAGRVLDLHLHPGQAEAIVTSLERVPNTVPVENIAVAEREMVLAARVNTPADLRRLGREALERLDPDGREPDEDAARQRETLSLGRAFKGLGVRFRGFLANENAELFQTLIDACSKPRKVITDSHPEGILDPRTKGQRQADALTQILHTAAATSYLHTTNATTNRGDSGASDGHGSAGSGGSNSGTGPDGTGPDGTGSDGSRGREDGDGGGQGGDGQRSDGMGIGVPAHGGIRPHILVTIGLSDLLRAGQRDTGDLLFGDQLSASAVRRLACDAQIIPIVLGTHSEPLDVGRDFRSVTPAIRTALIARDKGCVVCHAPPGHCDAHHLDHWADGGVTSVDNTALTCKPCHRDVHKGIYQLTIANGTVRVTGPHYKPRKPKHPTGTPTERPPPVTD